MSIVPYPEYLDEELLEYVENQDSKEIETHKNLIYGLNKVISKVAAVEAVELADALEKEIPLEDTSLENFKRYRKSKRIDDLEVYFEEKLSLFKSIIVSFAKGAIKYDSSCDKVIRTFNLRVKLFNTLRNKEKLEKEKLAKERRNRILSRLDETYLRVKSSQK